MTAIETSPPPAGRESAVLAALTAVTAVLVGALLWQGLTTWLEAISFVTGAWCVWLTVRENVWNFPVGMANVATFGVLFFRAGLYADTGLQVVYFVLGAIGWYLWLFGGAGRTALRVTTASTGRRLRVGLTVVVMWVGLFLLLRRTGDSAPFLDALTTALSLGAQWLTDRKNWESWLLWIATDVIYVPLYASKSLHLTAGLYAVFLVMAVIGLLHWRRVRDLPNPEAGRP
jgi:nicotinamide mononucleotide transporter